MTITLVSVTIAIVIGGIEAPGLVGDYFYLEVAFGAASKSPWIDLSRFSPDSMGSPCHCLGVLTFFLQDLVRHDQQRMERILETKAMVALRACSACHDRFPARRGTPSRLRGSDCESPDD